LTFSSNTQKLVILLFTLVVSIAFNACGDPLANQVTITTEPDNPEVVKVDLPADDDKFDGAVAPWFLLDYKIANASDQTFVLTRLELTSRRLGSVDSNSTVIEVSLLDNGEGYEDYPLAIAVVDPKSTWQSSNNGGPISNDERQGIVWYVQSLPVDANDPIEEQTTLYEVQINALGFFVPNDSRDNVTAYERSFKVFTE
jgi:hypothetical protein